MGLDDQGVDVALHEVPDGRIDQPVALQGRNTPERLGHDMYAKMAQAPGRAGMTGMQVALVLDDEFLRRKALRQDIAQARRPLRAIQGSTGRKGSTSTRPNTPAVT